MIMTTARTFTETDSIYEMKPIEDTFVWPMLGTKDAFLDVVEQAGMREGEHYTVKPDGSIWACDFFVTMIEDYFQETYAGHNKEVAESAEELIPLEEGMKSIGLKSEETTEWLIENGYLYKNLNGEIKPTKLGIDRGIVSVPVPNPRAIQSVVHIDEKNFTLSFRGPEGYTEFSLEDPVDLMDIWLNLGAPEDLAPEKWIKNLKPKMKLAVEKWVEGTVTDGDPCIPIWYLTSIAKDGPLVDYTMRMHEGFLAGIAPEPGFYLID